MVLPVKLTEKVGVVSLVRLSALDVPESLVDFKSTVTFDKLVIEANVKLKAEVMAVVLPAASV